MRPTQIDMLLHRAVQALQAGRHAEVQECCRRVLQETKNHPDAWALMGHSAYTRQDWAEAERCLKKCVTINPKAHQYQLLLAETYTARGRYKLALSRYDRLLNSQRNHCGALAGKARLLQLRGDTDQALILLEPVVDKQKETPELAAAYASLLNLKRLHSATIEITSRHIDLSDISEIHRRTLLYERGRAYEELEQYEAAFDDYTQSNAILPGRFNHESFIARMDLIIETYDPQRMKRLPRSTNESELPVFIVGMPRSGTTLLDRIIDAHPRAIGLEEAGILAVSAMGITLKIGAPDPYPQCIHDLDENDVNILADALMDDLPKRSSNVVRAADKTVSNDQFIGLALMLVPRARFIFIHRDPMDTGLSCFAELLSPEIHPWASNLQNIGRYQRQHERLIHHRHDMLDINALNVSYEELATQPEEVIRRIIDFLSLEWDDCCLHFHRTAGGARTLSVDQVRRPMYTSSIGRAARFGALLDPLLHALQEG